MKSAWQERAARPQEFPKAAAILASVRENTAHILAKSGNDPGQIERHLAFQTMLSELAADLVNLPFERLDDGILHTLERIARFGGEQRGWLAVLDKNGRWHAAQEWHEEGLEPVAAKIAEAVNTPPWIPWTLEQLSAGHSVWVNSASDLGPRAIVEQELFADHRLRSMVVVPIRDFHGELFAVAVFSSHDREGDWPEDFRRLCGLLGNMLCGALTRWREQRDLRRSEARLRCLLDSGMIGILTARSDGRVVDANEAVLAATGYDRAAVEAGEMQWDRMTPAEYRHLTTAAFDQLERTGHCSPWEQDFYRRDGSRVPVLLGLAAIHGDPGRFLVFAVDVTARRRAEHELTERKRLTRLITVLSTRFIGIALDRIDQAVAEALQEIGGVVGLDRCSIWQFVPQGGNEAHLTHRWDRRGETDGSLAPRLLTPPHWQARLAQGEFVLIRDGGRNFPQDSAERQFLQTRSVHSALAVPLLQNDSLIGFAAFVSERDDEEWSESRVALLRILGEIIGAALERQHAGQRRSAVRLELEKSFVARTGELEAANRELEAFSHAVSHDLRAPLRAIDGFSRILADDHAARLPEEARSLLERIRTTCGRMDDLIDALLTLSRIARSQPGHESVDVSAIASSLADGLREADPARRVTFVVEPDLVAEGEPRLLRVVLDNLLRNSWKFTATHEAARIEFGSMHDGRRRVFYVRDDGVGFDPSQAERLFRPFQRLHAREQFDGYGVGLATVQRIIRVHGGNVWAEGKPERGATVYFTLADSE